MILLRITANRAKRCFRVKRFTLEGGMWMKKKKQNKRKSGVPSQIQRLDKELAATIRLALELGLTEEQIKRRYHITSAQIDYSKKNGGSFDNLHSESAVNTTKKGR